jgi:hypothetical protein
VHSLLAVVAITDVIKNAFISLSARAEANASFAIDETVTLPVAICAPSAY